MILLQNKELYNNGVPGIIIANQSLVLQNVSRIRSGIYTCIGINKEGDGESNPVQLDIKCKIIFFYINFLITSSCCSIF